MTPSSQVIIVGGGIAGLATAFELHRRGIPFTLLESSSRPGGVILSERVGEFTVDAGPDSLLVQKPAGVQLAEEVGLGPRLVPTSPPRIAYIQRAGHLYPLPAESVLGIPTRWGPFIRTRLFSWPGKIRMGAEMFISARHDDSDESIGSFMRRRFGQEAVEYLAEPLLAGIHAGDVDRLSIRALFPQLWQTEHSEGSLLRGFRKRARPRSSDGAFRSLPGGLSELVHAVVAALPTTAIRLGRPVTRVTLAAPASDAATGYEVETGNERLQAAAVVLATPAFVTSELLRDMAPALSGLCRQIPYASTATIVMAFARTAIAHPLNGTGFVVPRREKTGILAASWLSSKWPHRAPGDHVLLRTFAGGARDPQALDRPDAELIEHSLGALRPLLGISGSPQFTRVYRWPLASAQHEVGHLARLDAIERELGQRPGLFISGSGFRGVGIPDCVADGRATAGQVEKWLQTTGLVRSHS